MDISALVKNLDHVCCRYRLAAFRPLLAAHGDRLDIRPWSAAHLFPGKLGKTDAVILQRLLLPGWQLSLLRRQARCLVFDFDDALYLRDSYDERGLAHPRQLRRFIKTVQAADVVVAGNDFLAAQASMWTTPDRVQMIPTCVDADRYSAAQHNHDDVRLVWIGSSSTMRGLERIRPLLDELGRRFPRLRLHIICDAPFTLDNLPVDFSRWSSATEASDLAASDIGISWLPEDDWSRGKCGLKILQYLAAGLPVIANPIGVQGELVRHGVNGYLVRSPEDWIDAVQSLVTSPELRRQMGTQGRADIRARYHVDHGGLAWRDLLTHLPRRATSRVCGPS